MLEKYAELLVKQGVNLQPGQELVIDSSIECFELVRAVAKVAYEVGAKDVIVNYTECKKFHVYVMKIAILNILLQYHNIS